MPDPLFEDQHSTFIRSVSKIEATSGISFLRRANKFKLPSCTMLLSVILVDQADLGYSSCKKSNIKSQSLTIKLSSCDETPHNFNAYFQLQTYSR